MDERKQNSVTVMAVTLPIAFLSEKNVLMINSVIINNNHSAVLVFRVSKVELRGHENSKGLDLTGVVKREE